VSGEDPNLFGRNWFEQFQLDSTSVFCLQSEADVDETFAHHKDFFKRSKLQGAKVKTTYMLILKASLNYFVRLDQY